MGQRAIICVLVGTFFGAAALLLPFASSVGAQAVGNVSEPRSRVEIPAGFVVTEAHIAILKNVLNLRPEQESYWVPVEAALRDLVRWQAATALQFETVEYANTRSIGANSIMTRFRRIAAAAVPLIKTLDEKQKGDVMMIARTFGLEYMLASS